MTDKEATAPPSRVGMYVVLVLYTLGALAGTWALGEVVVDQFDHGERLTAALVLAIAAIVAQWVALAGLWAMRKWGFKLLLGVVAVSAVLDMVNEVPALLVSAKVVLAGVLVFVVVPHWDRMRD